MSKMLVKYISYYLPGFFFSENVVKEYHGKVEWPDDEAYAYRIGERMEIEKEGETLKGKFKWEERHIRGRKMSKEDVKREVHDCHILLSNMENNGWEHVIKCPAGNFQPLEKDDVYEGNIK